MEDRFNKMRDDYEKLESDFLKLREENKEDREENFKLRDLIDKLSSDLQNSKHTRGQQSKDSYSSEDIEVLKQQVDLPLLSGFQYNMFIFYSILPQTYREARGNSSLAKQRTVCYCGWF